MLIISFIDFNNFDVDQSRKCPICERVNHIKSFLECNQCKEIICVDCLKHGGKYGVFCVNCFSNLTPEQKSEVLRNDRKVMFLNKYSYYFIFCFLIIGIVLLTTGGVIFSPFGYIGIYFTLPGFLFIGLAIFIGFQTIKIFTNSNLKDFKNKNSIIK